MVRELEPLTLDHLVSRLTRIVAQVEEKDPAGIDHALRLTASFGLYTRFDALRCEDRPFDRAAFAERLSGIEALLRSWRGVRGAQAGVAAADTRSLEEVVAELYSQCWANYDDQAFLESVDLFEERLRISQINPDFLKGTDGLDAGCGSGRYTIAMARLGAAHAIGIDISERAVREATQRSERLGMAHAVSFRQGSVIDMPAEWTGRFDFVCSNGVVHHTLNPTKGLQEIFRVLKPGGRAYVFVYGGGGLFWAMVDAMRALIAPVSLGFANAWLHSLGASPGKIFNFLDHAYVPMQERLTKREFESRLAACGFEGLQYMPRAKVYDASERYYRFPEERDLIGEGDLRYMVLKPTVRQTTGRARQVKVAAQ